VEVQRVSALTYVRLTQETPGVQPLSRVRDQKDAVIFASRKSGIAHLNQVAGRRAAFAHTNAVVSFWAKVLLARAGICGTDLKSFENLVAVDQRTGTGQEGSTGSWGGEGDIEDFAHSIVIKKVLAGEFDVGVAPSRRFEAHRGRRGALVEVVRFPVPSSLYVTKPDLDPQIFQALQQCLVSLKDKRLLGRMGPLSVNGFEAIKESDFDDIRHALTNELRCFETGRNPSAVEEPPVRPAGH
jgi:ABC-type phosphate/phosphonate transport system substrate-binding protein